MEQNPEIGLSVDVGGIATNYHRAGDGPPVVLIHGSGPGVSAWANWRLNLDALAEQNTVYAPDVVGFGFTDRPAGFGYGMDAMTVPEDAVRALPHETLVIRGREDRVIPLANALRLLELIEHTAEFNRLVGDFLRPQLGT
jgi:pimeloyl-ACP methyl ester carboxylesterase